MLNHFLDMPVNYGITVGLGIQKNQNSFKWMLPGLLQVYLFSQKLKLYIYRDRLELLSVRRKRRKLLLFYCIVNTNTPNYLCVLIPPTIQSTSVYPFRNRNGIVIPLCRLSSTRDYFMPSTIKTWNSLNNTIRNVIRIKEN